MAGSPPALPGLRTQLEAIDVELVSLLRRRMALAEDVMRAKLLKDSPIRDDAQGERVLERVRGLALAEGLNPYEVERLFRFIMEMSISRQQAFARAQEVQALRLAFVSATLDEASSSSPLSVYQSRRAGLQVLPFLHVREAVDALRRGEVHFALVPMETVAAGAVAETYAVLAEGGVFVTGEVLDASGRYVELALESVEVPGNVPCKTSFELLVQHRPGALGEVMQAFGSRGLNLTKIESRPLPDGSGRYRFFVDVEGHAASGPVLQAMEHLRASGVGLRVLGSFPRFDSGVTT